MEKFTQPTSTVVFENQQEEYTELVLHTSDYVRVIMCYSPLPYIVDMYRVESPLLKSRHITTYDARHAYEIFKALREVDIAALGEK